MRDDAVPERFPDDVARRLAEDFIGERFASPIEERFYHYLLKFLRPDVVMTREVGVPTILGDYRVDLVIQTTTRRIGIECDRKDFHEPHRDQVRDALIFSASTIDAIYRIRGADIVGRLPQVAYALARHESIVFRADAVDVLSRIGHRSEHRFERGDDRRDGPHDFTYDAPVDLVRRDRRAEYGEAWWQPVVAAVQEWVAAGGRGGAESFVAYARRCGT